MRARITSTAPVGRLAGALPTALTCMSAATWKSGTAPLSASITTAASGPTATTGLRKSTSTSFKNPDVRRGTAVLKAESPLGPFVPHSDGCVTPRDWECLDGTLYVDKAGKPWMVFCHEWVQAGDGEVDAIPLTDDLSAPAGEPRLLFRASEAPWCKVMHHSSGVDGCVTDGPFFWRTADGTLLCLWASFSAGGYTEGVAVSSNGEIDGTFTQVEPLFMDDGGHGMVFRALDGQLYLTLHSPNAHLEERPFFHPITERDGRLYRN